MERWKDLLSPENREIVREIYDRLDALEAAGTETYPARERIFAAVEAAPPETCRVIILGQDPYHEPGQANGLAFSVEPGTKLPPSLRNIYKELQADLGGEAPKSGDLRPWAQQGVLLLNTVLTVSRGAAFSHSTWGWQRVVAELLLQYAHEGSPKVFLLWGQQAIRFADSVPKLTGCGADWMERHPVLCSTHPSPLSAGRSAGALPAFLGSRPFSRCNALLRELGERPIAWECITGVAINDK